jgi:hypothetical protein
MILLTSCKITKSNTDNLSGTYMATGKDYNYQLFLNIDSTFEFKIKSLEAKSGCNGKWKYAKSIKLIILSCDEPSNVNETLQSGYMSVRTQEIKINNKNELLFNNKIVLKKLN